MSIIPDWGFVIGLHYKIDEESGTQLEPLHSPKTATSRLDDPSGNVSGVKSDGLITGQMEI